MGVNSLPKTVTRQHRGCDLNPNPTVLPISGQFLDLHGASIMQSSKGSNVTSVGWWVTPCDPTWHVSSCNNANIADCYTRIVYITHCTEILQLLIVLSDSAASPDILCK